MLARDHSISSTEHALGREVVFQVDLRDNGRLRTRTLLAGTVLGEHDAGLPAGLRSWQQELADPSSVERLGEWGRRLWGRGWMIRPGRVTAPEPTAAEECATLSIYIVLR